MKAIVVSEHGGPEVLKYTEAPDPEPGPGHVRVAIRAIGINRRDGFIRTGEYRRPLPLIPGIEAAGAVDRVGPDVSGWAVGDRVVYYVPDLLGAYAEYQVVPAERLARVPNGLSFEEAAAIFDHGLTAHYLTTSTFPVRPRHKVLVHAAAGGVGSLVVQFAKRAGATVFGTVSTAQKAAWVRQLGAEEVINYREQNFVDAVQRLTDGRGVDAVYDSVGKDTVDGSINSLAKRGMLILYGQSSGPVTSINPAALADRGSLFFTRPHLIDHVGTQVELQTRADDVFSWLESREISVAVDHIFPLAQAASAHELLADRSRWGKMLLRT